MNTSQKNIIFSHTQIQTIDSVLCWEQSHISRILYLPIGGVHAVTGGPNFQSHHHLAPQRKLRSPKLEHEALEISEVKGPFERKVHYSYFGPLW